MSFFREILPADPVRMAFVTALLTSSITATVAITTVVVTAGVSKKGNALKESEIAANANFRIANYRQEWIERLRLSVSEFIGQCADLVHNNLEIIEQAKYARIMEKTEYIRLLLNYNEQESKTLIAAMDSYFEFILRHKDEQVPRSKHKELREKVNESTRAILKKEWDRVRSEIHNPKTSKGK